MVRTDEYESLTLVLFFRAMILDVILGSSNLFIFEVPLSKLWSRVHEPAGKEAAQNGEGNVFHIYTFSHSKGKMEFWNDTTWALDWTQVCYIFPA